MIAKLKGIIDTLSLDHVLLDVNGVCYQVFASSKALAQLGSEGDRAILYTDTVIRNELPQLFGFISQEEQEAFRLLTTVQGIGAKVALAILSTLNPDELTLAIYNQDKAQITRADGVGPKLAVRLISELKDKVSGMGLKAVNGTSILPENTASQPSQISDAFSALESLGYKRSEAAAGIQYALQQLGAEARTADVIRVALSSFSNKKAG